MKIHHYAEFVDGLLASGFSMGGGNPEGIFSLIPWNWNQDPPYETPVRWHTGDPETDPWEWRMRVLDERDDIAYAKVFFRKSGFITRDWYPLFLAVRRGDRSFEEQYLAGHISHDAKRIYEILAGGESLPVHDLKQSAGFGPGGQSAFDRALVELQMGLFITMSGRRQKISTRGEFYGWSSTVFCTTETFWGDSVFLEAAAIRRDDAVDQISEQILRLNPAAAPRRISRFIGSNQS